MVTFLGRDGHRLTNLANLKYWGDAFCNYWGGWGPIIGGDIYPPSPPVSAPLLATIPSDIKAILPAAYLLKKQIRSHRAKQRIAPSTASTAADIVVPENYKVTAAGNNFLQADITTSRGKRVFIFSTDLVLDSINTSSIDTLFADGTFKISPLQFTQCWILRAQVGRHTNLPILYALLEDKHHTSYAAVMEFLHGRCPLFNPVTAIVDFETAEHKAILSVFPNTTLRGCLFHFCQCQLKQFKGVPFITTDEVLRSLRYSLFGLPFLPLSDVVNAWTELKTRLWFLYPTSKISEYIAYFEKTWLLSTIYPRLCGISTVRSSTMSPVLTTLPREGITLSTLPSLQPTPPSGSSSKRSPSSTLRRSLNIYRWRRVVNQQRGPRSSGGCGKRSSSGSSRIMTPTPRLTSAVVSATTITDSENHGQFIYKFLEHLFSSL